VTIVITHSFLVNYSKIVSLSVTLWPNGALDYEQAYSILFYLILLYASLVLFF